MAGLRCCASMRCPLADSRSCLASPGETMVRKHVLDENEPRRVQPGRGSAVLTVEAGSLAQFLHPIRRRWSCAGPGARTGSPSCSPPGPRSRGASPCTWGWRGSRSRPGGGCSRRRARPAGPPGAWCASTGQGDPRRRSRLASEVVAAADRIGTPRQVAVSGDETRVLVRDDRGVWLLDEDARAGVPAARGRVRRRVDGEGAARSSSSAPPPARSSTPPRTRWAAASSPWCRW
jgi:hypothetical protein